MEKQVTTLILEKIQTNTVTYHALLKDLVDKGCTIDESDPEYTVVLGPDGETLISAKLIDSCMWELETIHGLLTPTDTIDECKNC